MIHEDKQIADIVERIVRVAQPQKIILFGSFARKQDRVNSDFDLLVIKDGVKRRALAGEIYRSLIGVGRAVDVVVASSDDIAKYGDSPALVFKPALEEGQVIYAA